MNQTLSAHSKFLVRRRIRLFALVLSLLFLPAALLSSGPPDSSPTPVSHHWWKEKIGYMIYPRSFADSNGDGIGDIPGIIQHLDYIKSLGVDMIWIWSLYPSPNVDNGYDVSDYYSINPEFGTMADFDRLVSELHRRGIKLQMEMVSNHSSTENPWFVESRKSRNNPYRDYYFWRPGKLAGPPNDWPSLFGGSAWQLDNTTSEYYLHYFDYRQADLNWDNPKLRQEIYKIERFWLDKGVDGFRLDVITLISKQPTSSPLGPRGISGYEGGPHEHEYLQEMNREVFSRYDCATVGEGAFVPIENTPLYTADDRQELSMLFLFDHFGLGRGEKQYSRAPFDLRRLKSILTQWNDAIDHGGWIAPFIETGDMPRAVSAWGNDGRYRNESAKMLATLLLTLRGTPYIYQGQEIGMTNAHFSSLTQFRDIQARNFIGEEQAKGTSDAEILDRLNALGRDNTRTPMQWEDSKNAGFSTADKTWIDVNKNYSQINVNQSERDANSILNFYRGMIALRKRTPVLTYGEFTDLDPKNDNVFAYERSLNDDRILVILNFKSHPAHYRLPSGLKLRTTQLLVGNYSKAQSTVRKKIVSLHPYEALVYSIQ